MKNAVNVIYRDLLFLMIFVLMLMINPIVKTNEATRASGNMMVTAMWDPDIPYDVDLWIMGPMEKKPIGFSNDKGKVWNLLRDDLGREEDPSNLNYENSFSRGIPSGDYYINLHCFSCKGPIKTRVEVIMLSQSGTRIEIFNDDVLLKGNGDEITVTRFTINDNKLVSGSQHDIFKSLKRWEE